MTGITIGRVGLVDSLFLGKPTSWEAQDDQVTINGRLYDLSVTNALWLRRQLLNLAEEPDLVPVTWDGDTKIEGFYGIRSVSVPVGPGALRNGNLFWTVVLDRPPWWRAPNIEEYVIGAQITNTVGLAPTAATVSVIKASQNYATSNVSSLAAGAGGTSSLDLTGADGTVLHRYITAATTLPGVLFYNLAPNVWYDGGCQIEVGSSKLKLVGRTVDNDALNWRIGNDLVRVSSRSTGLTIGIWGGSSWETKDYDLYFDESLGNRIDTWDNMSVLSNTPERATIRCLLRDATTSLVTATADVTVLKGRRYVILTFTSPPAYTRSFGIRLATVEAATAVTGGIRATSNDGNGNRYFIFCPIAVTNDLVNGRIRVASPISQATFCLGQELNGSTQTVAEEQITGVAGLRDSFFFQCTSSRRPVSS